VIGIGIQIPQMSGGSGGFLPTELSGSVLWLRGDSGVEEANGDPAENSDTALNWLDRSGAGNHFTQPTALKRPTYLATGGLNGHPGLDFVTDDTLTRAALLTASTNYSFFVAFNQRNVATDQQLFSGSSNGNILENSQESTGDKLAWFSTGLGRLFFGAAQNGAQALAWIVSSTDVSVFRNDVQSGTTQGRGAPQSWGAQSWLGSNQDAGGFIDAIVSEVIMYDRALSGAEKTQVFDYLKGRYAL